MTLPLFDDEAARAPRRVTLVRLAGEVARAVAAVGRIQVEGEVHLSGGRAFAGWCTLRDRVAQVSVRVPRSAGRVRVVHGERVAVTGRLEWDSGRGQLVLVAEEVLPVGEGAVAALLADTRRRLAADGLLDRPRRRLPLLPTRIAVVCGTEAAVVKDIESVVAARFPGYPLHLEPTVVTGPGAPAAIVDALGRAVAAPGVEVIVLARGGGDSTALLPWSSEEVCRAVAACPVPVVSAIGHDGDRPLCDEVADVRCGTPSIAAASVVPDRADLVARCDGLLAAGRTALRRRGEAAAARHGALDPAGALHVGVDRAAVRLGSAGGRLRLCHPRGRLDGAARRVAVAAHRRPVWERLARAAGRLEADARHLRALAPERVLERGFAVVRTPASEVVRSARQVAPGVQVGVQVADGAFTATVGGV